MTEYHRATSAMATCNGPKHRSGGVELREILQESMLLSMLFSSFLMPTMPTMMQETFKPLNGQMLSITSHWMFRFLVSNIPGQADFSASHGIRVAKGLWNRRPIVSQSHLEPLGTMGPIGDDHEKIITSCPTWENS